MLQQLVPATEQLSNLFRLPNGCWVCLQFYAGIEGSGAAAGQGIRRGRAGGRVAGTRSAVGGPAVAAGTASLGVTAAVAGTGTGAGNLGGSTWGAREGCTRVSSDC